MKKPTIVFWQSVIMAGLVLVCVVLSLQNHALKQRLSKRRPMAIKLPMPGDTLRAVSYRSLAGDVSVVNYDDPDYGTYVLAVFVPQCSACIRTFPLWGSLSARLPAGVRFLALTEGSVDEVYDVMIETETALDVGLVDESFDLSRAMGINAVPATIVAGGGGIVKEAWGGPKNEETLMHILAEIEELLADAG
jgi:hypothetical protein